MKGCAPADTQDTLECSRQTTSNHFLFLILALDLRPSPVEPLQPAAAAAGFPRCQHWECLRSEAGFCLELPRCHPAPRMTWQALLQCSASAAPRGSSSFPPLSKRATSLFIGVGSEAHLANLVTHQMVSSVLKLKALHLT